MNNILVTGAAGFIGSTLMDKLIKCHTVGIDNFDTYYDIEIKKRNIANFYNRVFSYCLVKDKDKIETLFKKNNFDCVIHLAAKAGVRNSTLYPLEYIDHNMVATQNLLELCKRYDVKKFIFASSSSVYGNNKVTPFYEGLLTKPISNYAANKAACENLIHSYSYNYGIQSRILRFFTVYGPRQRPEMAIGNFIQKMLNNEPITVYGDGSIKRDFTYVDDIVQGIICSMNYGLNISNFELFNLGNSKPPITINELIKLLEDIMKVKAVIKYTHPVPEDMPITFSDITKATMFLRYRPMISLEQGLSNTVEWIKHLNGYERSSGNIFKDLELEHPEELLKKTKETYINEEEK